MASRSSTQSPNLPPFSHGGHGGSLALCSRGRGRPVVPVSAVAEAASFPLRVVIASRSRTSCAASSSRSFSRSSWPTRSTRSSTASRLLKVPRTVGALLVMVVIVAASPYGARPRRPLRHRRVSLAGEQLPEQLRALKERARPLGLAGLPHQPAPHVGRARLEDRRRDARAHARHRPGLDGRALRHAQRHPHRRRHAHRPGVRALPAHRLRSQRRARQAAHSAPVGAGHRRRSPPKSTARSAATCAASSPPASSFRALYSAGLMLAGIRLAAPIGFITGMLAFVPYIGFGIGLSWRSAMAILDWQGVQPPPRRRQRHARRAGPRRDGHHAAHRRASVGLRPSKCCSR